MAHQTTVGDGEVRRQLERELRRMRSTTADGVLEIAPGSGHRVVRAAYLATVKRYHPHRFARMGSEIEALANEIFLLVKDAYDQLSAEATRRPKRTPAPRRSRRPSAAVTFRKRRRTTRPAPPPAAAADPPVAPVPRARSRPADLIAKLEDQEREQRKRFTAAVQLLEAGRFGEARQAFRELATANPNDRRYRVHMHYAWGCEHQAAGRADAAATELRRALAIDGSFAAAAEALSRLDAGGERPGLLGRLFRRGR